MKNSDIPIKWEIHCNDYVSTHELDWNVTYWDPYGQVFVAPPEDKLQELLDYYNSNNNTLFIDDENQRQRTISSDVTILIRDDIGDSSVLAPVWGIQKGKSSIFVRPEFVFQKYQIMHGIGHIFGCGHEADLIERLRFKPAVFFAQSYKMPNGYCGVMSNPVKSNCTKGAFFSNPEANYKGEATGQYYANNALWIKHNRYHLNLFGNELIPCPSDKDPANFMHNRQLLDCYMDSSDTSHCQKLIPSHIWF